MMNYLSPWDNAVVSAGVAELEGDASWASIALIVVDRIRSNAIGRKSAFVFG